MTDAAAPHHSLARGRLLQQGRTPAMVRRLRRALVAAAAGSLLLTGCATSVVGSASPGDRAPVDISADDFPITGAVDGDLDQYVRNALGDLQDFWEKSYPEFFGGELEPLSGGYFSVDSDDIDSSAYPRSTGIGCADDPTDPDAVAGNAFYNPNCDSISYDRALLQELSDDYGPALGPFVLAHEFGHAIQGRVGFAASGRSIQDETQADCFAGAWAAWVVAGNAEHVSIRAPELDDVITGYLTVSDPVGSDPDDSQAHGSYFDRVSAIAEGYDGGIAVCRDDFGADRLFTAAAFANDTEYVNQGNAPYVDIVGWIGQTLPEFWGSVFPDAFGKDFQAPQFEPFDTTAPDCGGDDVADQNLGYCAHHSTVFYDEKELTQPAYQELGDFAVATALALPYSLAARGEGDLSVDDATAARSAVCLTGWYTAQWYSGAFADTLQVQLSPGDVDEAVQFLLRYGVDPTVFPNTALSGFEMVGAFRSGFLEGGIACDIGL
jgi:predicted metalloprotease